MRLVARVREQPRWTKPRAPAAMWIVREAGGCGGSDCEGVTIGGEHLVCLAAGRMW